MHHHRTGLRDVPPPPGTECQPPTDLSDEGLIKASLQCGLSAAYANSDLLQNVWKSAYTQAGIDAAAGAAIGVSFAEILSFLGAKALSELLVNLVIDIAAEMAITISAGAAAGSVFPVVGTIIGTIVGAIIGGLEVILYSCSIQITNGKTFDCDNYVNANLKSAALWLNQNQNRLGGLTPLAFANQANIFLANPVWMFNNQGLLGIQQPSPPDSSSDTGKIYYSYPGAFELLNRAQLPLAVMAVVSSPGKLPFWSSTPIGGVQSPDPNAEWQPGSNFDSANAWSPSGTQVTVGSNVVSLGYTAPPGLMTGVVGAGAYALQHAYPSLTKSQCDKIFASAQKLYADTVQAAMTWANTQCFPPDVSTVGTGSPYNLEPADVNKVIGQWKPPSTCTALDPVALLQNYANAQCPQPTTAWVKSKVSSITDAQAQQIVGNWHNPQCVNGQLAALPPGGAVTATASPVVTTTAVVAGLSALGILLYARANHIAFSVAAKHLGSRAVQTIKKPFTKTTHRRR